MKGFSDTVVAFKLVWIRVACYFILPFGVTFLSLTEKYTGQSWQEALAFEKYRLFVSCGVSGLTSFVAYLDSSFAKATANAAAMKEKREAETAFKNRPENG